MRRYSALAIRGMPDKNSNDISVLKTNAFGAFDLSNVSHVTVGFVIVGVVESWG